MVRLIKESALSRPEIADMLVVAGFGNEEEGYLDYFLEYNPKYVASVNLDDMGAYIDDLDTGEHIPLPFANGADRVILRTKEDVRAFLDYIYELDYDDIFESVKTNRRRNTRFVKEARTGRTKSIYVSQEYVPSVGWEDVTVYDDVSDNSYRQAKQDVRDYKDNGYNARVITRKIDNPDYVEPTYELTSDQVLDWVENECPYEYSIEDSFLAKHIALGKHDVIINIPDGPDSVMDNSITITDLFEKRTYKVNTLSDLIKKVDRIMKKYEKMRASWEK